MRRVETSTISTKLAIGIIGGSAVVGVAALFGGILPQPSDVTTANTTLNTDTPTTPSITMAVPSITGKAPLYSGQAPNANPQG